MKIKNLGMAVATIAIVGCGSLLLLTSIAQIKGAVQNDASGDIEMLTNASTTQVSLENDEEEDAIYEFDNNFDNAIKLYDITELDDFANMETITSVDFIYAGKVVSICDGLVTRDEAVCNATEIMNYIYSYVDELILTPNDIDKTAYEYEIQRQYGRMYGDEDVNYGVFMLQDDEIKCTIGITLGEELKLHSFSMDGLRDVYGGTDNEIPKEYLRKNWCATTEQREEIYNKYLSMSKNIVENVLGLPAIREEIADVDCGSYFAASDVWSEVSFGYVLENGMYINVFYNRVNGEWIGYTIAGYYQE